MSGGHNGWANWTPGEPFGNAADGMRQRTLAAVGKPGQRHNRSEPEPCEKCGKETCVRRFDGTRWRVLCAEHAAAKLTPPGETP